MFHIIFFQVELFNWAEEGKHAEFNIIFSPNRVGYFGDVDGSAVRKVRAREEGRRKVKCKKNT